MPAINIDSYEVGKEFYSDFLTESDVNDCFFMIKNDSVFFNLKEYANIKLQNLKINKAKF